MSEDRYEWQTWLKRMGTLPGLSRHPALDALEYIKELESRLDTLETAGRQMLESFDAIIGQVGSDVLPKGWLASANVMRKALGASE